MTSTPCPHCHLRVRHGASIGCCSGCGRCFTSGTAFEKHLGPITDGHHEHRDPATVGLVPKTPKTDPDGVMWGLPPSDRGWDAVSRRRVAAQEPARASGAPQ